MKLLLVFVSNINYITKVLPEKPVLLLDVPTLQMPVLVYVSTPQGPELHLDVSTLQRGLPVLLLDVYTPQWPKLHLDVSTLQRPVLHLDNVDMSTHRGRSCTWSCQHYKGLCCI